MGAIGHCVFIYGRRKEMADVALDASATKKVSASSLNERDAETVSKIRKCRFKSEGQNILTHCNIARGNGEKDLKSSCCMKRA